MKNFNLLLFSLFALLFFSCQSDTETTTLNADKSFTKTSPISSLISRVSQYETTADNVIDGTSNCSIKLPVHIDIDGHLNVLVASEADFQSVQNIKDESYTDDDKVNFHFPITIIYPNHNQHIVDNEAQFENILAGYGDDTPYRDIACINFNYPISINIYNTNNQVASSSIMNNDTDFYNFMENMATGEIAGIVFPITLTKTMGGNVTVNNDTQLESAINNAIEECTVPGANTLDLSDVLKDGYWHVSYFYEDNDETNLFTGYNFTFNTGDIVKAVKNSSTSNAHWDTHYEMNYQRLDLSYFNGSILEELNGDWTVVELTSTFVRFKHESGGNVNNNQYLSLIKN